MSATHLRECRTCKHQYVARPVDSDTPNWLQFWYVSPPQRDDDGQWQAISVRVLLCLCGQALTLESTQPVEGVEVRDEEQAN